jgi:hypothetical protein
MLDDRCSGTGALPSETVPCPVGSPVQVLPTRWGLFPTPRAPPSAGEGRCRANTTPGDERRELSRPVTTPGDDPPLPLVRFRNKRRPRGRDLLRCERTWLESMDLLQAPDNPRPRSPRLLHAPGAPPSNPDGSPGASRTRNLTFRRRNPVLPEAENPRAARVLPRPDGVVRLSLSPLPAGDSLQMDPPSRVRRPDGAVDNLVGSSIGPGLDPSSSVA